MSLAASRISLLTSDRPLDMPHGLGSSNAYIALPIGPRTLFVADHDGTSAKRLGLLDPTSIVRNINIAVVQQARQWFCRKVPSTVHIATIQDHEINGV